MTNVRTKVYEKADGLNLESLLECIEIFLDHREDMAFQTFSVENGYAVQTQKRDEWKKYVLLDNALQINIIDIGSHIQVEIGGAKWASKAIAGGFGLLGGFSLFSLALVAFSAYGAADLYSLPDRIFSQINAIFPGTEIRSQPSPSTKLLCPQCGAPIARTSNFCPNCGEKLTKTV